MSNIKHTAEPWEVGASKQSVVKADGQNSKVIASIRTNDHLVNPRFQEGEAEANAERIVACVNACEGITNEELNAGGGFWGRTASRQRERLQQAAIEKIELFGLLKRSQIMLKYGLSLAGDSFSNAYNLLEDIEKVVGKEHSNPPTP
jgi:hypothetical protein